MPEDSLDCAARAADSTIAEPFRYGHAELRNKAIALLNPGDGVPRSRSFDMAVRLGISLHVPHGHVEAA